MRGREIPAVWILLAAVATAILVTYSRLPARELYHVSGSGFGAGLGRVVVFLNFPAALIAIAILAVTWERLPRGPALGALVLCLPVFWPGVVRQSNLDARWVNLPCALGVALAALLTFGVRMPVDRRGDRLRIAIAVVALLAAPEWIAAELGFFLPVYEHVHHGHHHGLDGFLLIVTALWLSRLRPRKLAAAYLALMFAYGVGNELNDFWGEQVVARGWTSWAVPSVLEPRPTWAWLCIVSGAAVVWLGWLRRRA